MTENVQRGAIFELISNLKLITIFLVYNINLQYVLYFTAFLAFGIGDGITGAYMMDTLGTGIESNPIARYLFMEQGFGGMVMVKIWFTFLILLSTHIIQLRSPDRMYWTVNGFLIALTAGGLMATNANLTALAGEIPQAPGEIIFTYLALVLILTEIGSFADGRTQDTAHNSFETVAHSCFIFPERRERK
ncbi:MAG: hypothetical protein Q8O17_02610 [Candidatus Methanoperedens sp.]|nr:hypothetical protein [Candidatus Methanoperedens sp.]